MIKRIGSDKGIQTFREGTLGLKIYIYHMELGIDCPVPMTIVTLTPKR